MSIKGASLLVILLSLNVEVLAVGEKHMVGTVKPQRAERMLGGWEERSPDDEDIQQLLPSILTKVNEQSNDEFHLVPIKLLKASSQVVAGMKYKIEVQVARSECKKSSNEKVDLKACKKLEGHPEQVMTLEVWEKPWENFLKVTILDTKLLSRL